MRETTFIKQKRKRWEKFEKIQQQKSADPDEVTKLFVEITDDLSYSRTFYAKRSVRVYLNYLSQLVFLKVNKNKSVGIQRFFKFWTHGLPMEIARSWKQLLLAFVIFFGAMMVGIVSTANDIGFATKIMGQAYIDRTNENIESGDPMAIYHQNGNAYSSTFQLTANNTKVAAYTYTSGFLAGIPPILIMVDNGIMLGTFHYYLYEKGVLNEAMWVIWIHGVLEIWAIIIAGAAGLILGGGILFPGTYTRLQSLRISAKRSFKIAISTIFILIISGFIEGSVTRFTQMPMLGKYAIVIGSLLFILFYFVLYPTYLYQKKIKTGAFVFEDKIPHSPEGKIELEKTREIGDLYNDSLNVFKHIVGAFMKGWMALSLPICLATIAVNFIRQVNSDLEYYWWVNVKYVLTNDIFPYAGLVIFAALTTSIFLSVYYAIYLYKNDLKFKFLAFYKFCLLNIYKLWPLSIFIALLFLVPNGLMVLAFILCVPFIFQLSYAGFYKEGRYGNNLRSGNKLIWKSWFGSIGFFLLLSVIPTILMLAAVLMFGPKGLGAFELITQFILQHFEPFVDNLTPIANGFNFFLYFVFFTFILAFVLIGMAVQFHTVRERIEAHSLYNRLQDFGLKHNLFEQADEGDF